METITLIRSANINLFGGHFSESPLATCSLATLKFEENGSMWYFNQLNLFQNKNYPFDNRIQLLYSNQSPSDFVRLFGIAELMTDPKRKRSLWDSWTSRFSKFPLNPTVTLLHFDRQNAYYKNIYGDDTITLVENIMCQNK